MAALSYGGPSPNKTALHCCFTRTAMSTVNESTEIRDDTRKLLACVDEWNVQL